MAINPRMHLHPNALRQRTGRYAVNVVLTQRNHQRLYPYFRPHLDQRERRRTRRARI